MGGEVGVYGRVVIKDDGYSGGGGCVLWQRGDYSEVLVEVVRNK